MDANSDRPPAERREADEDVGVVAIGRNEGERLRRCLESIEGGATYIVYVDSGSTDGSVEMARAKGVEVVDLDMSVPFTMARGRNHGFSRLLELSPDLAYVQFVDGDCEVCDGWLAVAREALERDSRVAIVAGRRRERFPEHSVYNRLCDIEWNDFEPGEVMACGGDVLMRVDAFRQVDGFNAGMIAGEEPELCIRLRAAGWKIVRLNAPMTIHDATMTRFGQWWKRAVRSGHAYAERAWLHRHTAERPVAHQVRSIWAYGLVLPLLIAALAWPTRGASLAALAVYPASTWRVHRHSRRRGLSAADSRLYALSCVLAKFPLMLGQAKYHLDRLRGKRHTLIEYK